MRASYLAGCCIAAALFVMPVAASAQTPDVAALQRQIDELRQQLQALQDQLSKLGTPPPRSVAVAPPPSDAAAPPSPPVELTAPADQSAASGAAGSAKVFNPDMAVIGDFLGAMGRNTVNPSPALEMHESEASFQAVVDPYARGDFFISFGEEGVELEEGFVTFPALPGGLLFRAGKMRAAFGKVNSLHNHVLPWADRPLVTQNLVNGEDGIDDAGLSVARLIPNPWFFLEGTGQVFRGDSGALFTSQKRGDLSYVGHVRGYQDITENTNIDLGVSYSRGHNASGLVDGFDVGRNTTQLAGVDATVRWRPLSRSIYHSFIGRSEVIWSRRQQPLAEQRSNGFYLSGDYQLARRWFAGARYDQSDRADSTLRDSGHSLTLTYWPSEFSQVRGQYRRTKYAEAETANELLFQFQFSIGAHGAHPF